MKFIPNARDLFLKFWVNRVQMLVLLSSIFYAIMPVLQDYIPPQTYATIMGAASVVGMFVRMLKQTDVPAASDGTSIRY